jgi:small-conductance mechanosensitive channel
MKIRQWITGLVLLLLMTVAVVGLLWTREPNQPDEDSTPAPEGKRPLLRKAQVQRALVDQRPLQTAQRLTALAITPEELRLAHEAEKVGDHEVDLAFFDALRAAQENPPQLSPEAKQISDRKDKADQALKREQETIARLTRKLAAAPETQKDNLQDQIDVAKAQLELDQDEASDAADDLEQAGGDPQAKIKRMQAEHEASGHGDAPGGPTANPHEQDYQSHTLWAVYRAWQALREKAAKLEDARQEAVSKQARLSERHKKLAAQVEHDTESRGAAKEQASDFSQGTAKGAKAASREESKAAAQAALDSLKHYARGQRNLADLGRRMQDEQELGDLYANWITVVETRQRAATHNLIFCGLWILFVIFLAYLTNRLIDRLLTARAAENKRIDTLRTLAKFGVQVVALIIVSLVVLGVPTQVATILGFAGAGLTVALKDFIVPFFGWFVLMGTNGIRVGDWVEINGVAGEVVEIGLLRTVLMETGNWTDAGHPTGRKVAFPNSFAIEGHFFNLSTSGQWMWDELQLSIPSSQDPYAIIDGLQKLVTEDTEGNARKAMQEWQSATTRYRVKSFTAEPAINVRPTGSGVDVTVRYITRAYERHETRKRLYKAVFELMQGTRGEAAKR